MDVHTSNVDEKQRASASITSALISAVLEWLLICLIFIGAIFSYLVTKFARYSKLQIPCLLCSRLDHVLGNERGGLCWDLVCRKHKSKISSLIICQLHNKLIDVHGTCESCFFSFATINKSNAETYRLLVGKLGSEPHHALSEGNSPGEDHNLDSLCTKKCFCCNEQWNSRSYTHKIFHTKSIDSEVNDVDESATTLIREMETPRKDEITKYTTIEPQIVALPDYSSASTKLINPNPSVSFSHLEFENTPTSFSDVESGALLQHGLEELKWQQAEQSNAVSVPSELISFDDIPPFSSINETQYDLKETIIVTSTTKLDKEVKTDHGLAPVLESDSRGKAELVKDVAAECGETSRATSNSISETYSVESDSVLETDIHMDSKPSKTGSSPLLDLGDAYKLALGTRGRQLSGRLLEHQRSITDSSRACEDLKVLLTQISANYDISPRVSANYDDYKAMESSGFVGMRRISLERNESNLSVDGSSVSEIEGESSGDRLKRQVEHDKKVMSALYKELEEERNASAVAANQAMAMITRLQEEKSALTMEALQFLRMMEEQAEYDGEALQRANDMLTEKEKQIQDFDSELELYRNQCGSVSLFEAEINERKLEADSGEGDINACQNLDK